ncbi:MAG: hypothetical protein ACHREM_08800 [Polyangiales bacterium]
MPIVNAIQKQLGEWRVHIDEYDYPHFWSVAIEDTDGVPLSIGHVSADGKISIGTPAARSRRFNKDVKTIVLTTVAEWLEAGGQIAKGTKAKERATAGSGAAYRRGPQAGPHGSARRYRVRFVHKISPKSDDYGKDVYLTREDLKSTTTLAASLRSTGALLPGQRLRESRVERDGRVVAFPLTGIWHSIILEPV